MSNWNLGQFVTIDEIMVRYKRKYGHGMKQYIPNKPVKFGLKIWAAMDLDSKYLHNFQVYTGADSKRTLRGAKAGEAKTGYKVVMHLMRDLHGLRHMVVMDNFFTSPRLLVDLFEKGTMETGIVRHNRVGPPSVLMDVKKWGKEEQGTIGWQMHCKGDMCCVVWIDKKSVLLLSTHGHPLSLNLEHPVTVP